MGQYTDKQGNKFLTSEIVMGAISDVVSQGCTMFDIADTVTYANEFSNQSYAAGEEIGVKLPTYPIVQYGQTVSVSPKSSKKFAIELIPRKGIINIVHGTDIISETLYLEKGSPSGYAKKYIHPTAAVFMAAINEYFIDLLKRKSYNTLLNPEIFSGKDPDSGVFGYLSQEVFINVDSFRSSEKIKGNQICVAHPKLIASLRSKYLNEKYFTDSTNEKLLNVGATKFSGYDIYPCNEATMFISNLDDSPYGNLELTLINFSPYKTTTTTITSINSDGYESCTAVLKINLNIASGLSKISPFCLKDESVIVFSDIENNSFSKKVQTLDEIYKKETGNLFTCNLTCERDILSNNVIAYTDKECTVESNDALYDNDGYPYKLLASPSTENEEFFVKVKLSRFPIWLLSKDINNYNENINVNSAPNSLSNGEYIVFKKTGSVYDVRKTMNSHYKVFFLVDNYSLIGIPSMLDEMKGLAKESYSIEEVSSLINKNNNKSNDIKKPKLNGLKMYYYADSKILEGQTFTRICTFLGGGVIAKSVIQVLIDI